MYMCNNLSFSGKALAPLMPLKASRLGPVKLNFPRTLRHRLAFMDMITIYKPADTAEGVHSSLVQTAVVQSALIHSSASIPQQSNVQRKC